MARKEVWLSDIFPIYFRYKGNTASDDDDQHLQQAALLLPRAKQNEQKCRQDGKRIIHLPQQLEICAHKVNGTGPICVIRPDD